MLEQRMVEQAAPTLAGIKPANLYPCPCPKEGVRVLAEQVSQWNRQFSARGIRTVMLGRCKANRDSCLLYTYRPAQLQKILADPAVRRFLTEQGYGTQWGIERCLALLAERIRQQAEFPHEIGIFLGYPLRDVAGFIQNKGKNYSCTGLWKVYGDPAQAQKQFARYHHCTQVYRQCYRQGRTMHQLTVPIEL